MKYIVYDIETLPNIFSVDLKDPDTNQRWIFEMSWRKDQRKEFIDFLNHLRVNKVKMVGFNNQGFDYPVVHWFIENWVTASVLDVYRKAQQIINIPWNQRFAAVVRDSDQYIQQVDLFKVHHFDNVSRMTSLKMLEFNMRMNNICEMPHHHTKLLTSPEKDELLAYGSHDVDATTMFFHYSEQAVAFREELTEKRGVNCMNSNDTKIGKDYMISQLELAMPGCCYDKSSGKSIKRQTKRDVIHLKDVIFPYINFEHPSFQAVLEWMTNKTITETKGAFTGLLEADLGDLSNHCHMTQKKKKGHLAVAGCWYEENAKGVEYTYWNEAPNINCVIDNFRYDFGTGGIHGSVDSQIVRSDDDLIIEDWDVASYYPNLAIKNRIYPKHLSEKFCDIYEDVYNERKTYAKKTVENAALKLALNGTYGDSNSEYSPLYDPQYTMAITINGQLSLCMLAEQLIKIDGLRMIQVNTDGLTIQYPRIHQEFVHKITDWWQELTKLDLEVAEYRNMYVRDVNSYIGEFMNGKTKRIGAYGYERAMENPSSREVMWHKNHGALVVPKAAEAALVHGTPIREFIENHSDIHDFMISIKVPKNSILVTTDLNDEDTKQQNICRYYVSIFGDQLTKIMPPLKQDKPERRFNMNVGWRVTICNDMADANHDDIEFEWYIQAAEKLVKPLRGEA